MSERPIEATDQVRRLQEENAALRSALKKSQIAAGGNARPILWLGRRFVGVRVNRATGDFKKKLDDWQREPRVENLPLAESAELGVALLMRMLRSGMIGLALAMVPLVFLGVQTLLLSGQNQRLDLQNELLRTQQQTALLDRVDRTRDDLLAGRWAELAAVSEGFPATFAKLLAPMLSDTAVNVDALRVFAHVASVMGSDSLNEAIRLVQWQAPSFRGVNGLDLRPLGGVDLAEAATFEGLLSNVDLRGLGKLNATTARMSNVVLGGDLSMTHLPPLRRVRMPPVERAHPGALYVDSVCIEDGAHGDVYLSGASDLEDDFAAIYRDYTGPVTDRFGNEAKWELRVPAQVLVDLTREACASMQTWHPRRMVPSNG